MSRPLALWEGSQEQQLKALTEASDQTLLLRLLEASCMGEFAKLTAARLDLPTWAQTALDVLGQFLPLSAGCLSLAAPGVPELSVTFGDRQLNGGQSFPLTLDGEDVGALDVVVFPGAPVGPELFASVAGQISLSLAAVVEAERLRRQAAADRALSLAATLEEPYQEAHLQSLVNAIAGLPGATGARLELDSITLGGPFDVTSGILGTVERFEAMSRGDSQVRVSLTRSPFSRSDEPRVVDELLAAIVAAVERAELSRRLREEVETDPLTGVGNRRRANAALRAAIGRAERMGEDVAVIALDLDHFKKVNDTLGHDTGDRVLVAFAGMLVEQCRVYDTVARIGGEEFLVICPATDAFGARALAERLLRVTPSQCAPSLPDGWRQTASIGIAIYPKTATTIDALLRAADEALYDAKRNGRDRLTLSSATSAALALQR